MDKLDRNNALISIYIHILNYTHHKCVIPMYKIKYNMVVVMSCCVKQRAA